MKDKKKMITRFLVAGALAVCSLFVEENAFAHRNERANVQSRCMFIGENNVPVSHWYAREMYEFYQSETPLWYKNSHLVTLFLIDVGVQDATEAYTETCLMPLIEGKNEYTVITTLFEATGVKLVDLEDLDVLILLNFNIRQTKAPKRKVCI